MNDPTSHDPWSVLGLATNATTEQIRARYLELVQQFPPDREPERFSRIQEAYETVRDPLQIWWNRVDLAERGKMINHVDAAPPPPQPRIPTDLLLSAADIADS